MHKKLTWVNITLTLFSVIVSTLFVMSRSNYWCLVDFFAWPFLDTGYLGNFYQISNEIKAAFLETFISLYGYDLSIIFQSIFTVTVILCVGYVFIRRKNGLSYVPMLVCIVGVFTYSISNQEISLEEVGRSIYEQYDYKDSEINYLELLRNKKFSELDMHFERVENNFANKKILEYQYNDEYIVFESADDNDLPLFEQWLSVTKDKRVVLTARALLYDALGWDTRGSRYAKHVSDKQFDLMEEYFDKAFYDHEDILAINKKSLLSYASMIYMASAMDFDITKHAAFEMGIKEYPSSEILAHKYLHVLKPRWGGTYKEMRNLVVTMRQQAANNPRLISLGNVELRDRMKQAIKDDNNVLMERWQKFSMLYGILANQVVDLAITYENKKDNVKAIQTLNYGLQLYPKNTKLLINRAYYYSFTDNLTGAKEDLSKVSPENVKVSFISDRAADVHKKLKNFDKAIEFYKRTIEIDPRSEYPYNRLYYMSYERHFSYKDALPYMKQWTDMQPTNSDAWISYAGTLKEIDKKASVAAYKNFIKYANTNIGYNLKAVRHAEKFIQLMEKNDGEL